MPGLSLRDEIIRASSAVNPGDDVNRNGIETASYDPLKDVMDLFCDPGCLAELDKLMAYTNSYKLEIEKDIIQRRHDYNSRLAEGEKPVAELEGLDTQLDHLTENFNSTKTLAEDTGSTINKMTANIKNLDNCKRNLTLSMTILKRLQMLVMAYDSLKSLVDGGEGDTRDYTEVKGLLSAVLELMQHFQNYKSIDEINTLNKKIGSLKNKVIDEIFKDFESELSGELKNATLSDACGILDMFGKAYRDKLTKWYISALLKEITDIFKSSEEAGSLENLNRRYIFFQRILTNFESEHSKMFPRDWKMPILLSRTFCELTNKDLKEVTGKDTRLTGPHVDTNLLLTALAQTLDFELYLNQKFKMYSDFGDDSTYTFDRSISDVFEPYLNVWIDHQGTLIEKKFVDYLNPSNLYRKSGIAETDQPEGRTKPETDSEAINVLESAADLFRTYRQMLGQLAKLTHGRPLVRLCRMFSKYLIEYETRVLEPMVPDLKQLSSANAKEQSEIIDIVCLVLNTADYCSSTTTQLELKMTSLLDPAELAKDIDFSNAKGTYLALVTRCMTTAYSKIDSDLQYSWREMANNNWRMLKEVTGESRHLTSIKSTLNEDCELVFSNFNKTFYVRNFIDKLVEMVVEDMTLNIIRLQPISEVMAEQFVLDLQTLNGFFLDLPLKAPNGAKIKMSPSFGNFIDGKIFEVVSLMKVLMVSHRPADSYIINYFCNIKDSSYNNFIKTLKLKGLLRNDATFEKDKFKYLDTFKTQLRSYQEANDDALDESNSFLEKLNVDATNKPRRTGVVFSSQAPQSQPTSPSMGSNISNFFNSSTPNFKIDRHAINNTRENLEKNLVKTFSDNKININENIRSFGKFFKKGT
ncbi:DEKNAAC102296 [Brettanomyces naardenensis]|uniref:DEKNAAC102296 n=1 Tax=Brettanomyces naardenensis TaxID=13370 RepID=A0A448YKI5_BRENA|nr:DEKNAAC102296 [Brettanomyces naardenensis]